MLPVSAEGLPDLNGMSGTLLLATIVFTLTEILKSAIGINGNKTAVRYLVLFLSLIFSFGNQFLTLKTHLSWSTAFTAIQQAILATGVALGGHVVRSDSNGLGNFLTLLKTRGEEQQVADAAQKAHELPAAPAPMPEPPVGALTSPNQPLLAPVAPVAPPNVPRADGAPAEHAERERIAQLLMSKLGFTAPNAFAMALRNPEAAKSTLQAGGHWTDTEETI